MTIGHKLGMRLFLEGVEIPVIGASISVAPNTPTACSLQVIPTDKVLELLPRTTVHLFFYDFVGGVVEEDGALPEDIANSAYKLLFMGEVQGLAFQKGVGQRGAMLNCVDFSNYWDTTYQYNFKGSLISGQQYAAFVGANANWLTGPLGHGVGSIAALLNGRSVNYPYLKGLLAGIVRVLETIGGSYYGDTTFKGANDFVSIAELRIKLLQQICAAEKDDSTSKLFVRKAFNMWMNRQMGGLGKLVTFRGLTQLLQKFIFHDVYPCPVAKYEPIDDKAVKKKTYVTDLAKDPKSSSFVKKIKKLRSVLHSASINITNYSTPETDWEARPTSNEHPVGVNVFKGLSADLAQADNMVRGLMAGGTPKIPGLEKEVSRINKDLLAVDKNIGRGNVSLLHGPNLNVNMERLSSRERRKAAFKALTDAKAACDALLGIKVKTARNVSYEKLDRVNNQILRPDIWFVSPPRCNVLFPELYASFNWSRNFLREVSRLEMQTTHEILGDDALFNGRYYAPNIEDMRKGVKLSSRMFGRLTMQHELLTGIIPMFEKLSEANLYAMKSRKVKSKGASVSYAQRAVNFQYFKHRFASRQMQCQGRFNPWFAPGFPGLVIDRPMDADNIIISSLPLEEQLRVTSMTPVKGVEVTRGTILRTLVPTQFLGCCVGLSHSLSQQGGDTSYSFGQARIHREGTEYMGVDKATVTRIIGYAVRTTLVAADPSNPPKPKMRGPLGGVIQSARDVTNDKAKDYYDYSLPVYGMKSKVKVLVGSPVSMAALEYYDPNLGPGEQMTSDAHFRAYEVVEVVARKEKSEVDLPIEDAVRPPWIWDGYSNMRVGATYMQFFGVNSITDIEGYTSSELITTLEGSDSAKVALEAQEGITYGPGKKEGKSTDQWARKKPYRTQDKPRKNRAKKGDVNQQEEIGTKVGGDTLMAMSTDRTIESSVDYLVRVYSFIKHHGLDVGGFLRNYTYRPVATLTEIMGSVNFNITKNEKYVPPVDKPASLGAKNKKKKQKKFTKPKAKREGEYVITGQEGFHSRAFGDVADLFGLVDPEVKKILGLSKDKNKEKESAAKKLDARAIKRAAVWDYAQELAKSKGLLG